LQREKFLKIIYWLGLLIEQVERLRKTKRSLQLSVQKKRKRVKTEIADL